MGNEERWWGLIVVEASATYFLLYYTKFPSTDSQVRHLILSLKFPFYPYLFLEKKKEKKEKKKKILFHFEDEKQGKGTRSPKRRK